MAAFVALSSEGRAGAMWMELKKVTMDMGNPSKSEVSAQDEAAMRLKPNKYFKRVSFHCIHSSLYKVHKSASCIQTLIGSGGFDLMHQSCKTGDE